jgi:hypothetical protein
MSPTVELSCATAIANFSAERALMGKLYRFGVPPGNGVCASLTCRLGRANAPN